MCAQAAAIRRISLRICLDKLLRRSKLDYEKDYFIDNECLPQHAVAC